MRYGVLGAGMVGQTLATRLTELSHDVMMGFRGV
jgi:predicted dinucleotide-binding enzyme